MRPNADRTPRRPVFLLDTEWSGAGVAGGPPNPTLLARNAYIEKIKTAQDVADLYGLTGEGRRFRVRSQQHAAAAARDSGRLLAEIDPVEFGSSARRGRPR